MVMMNIREKAEVMRRFSTRHVHQGSNNGPSSKNEAQKMVPAKQKSRKKSLFPLTMGFGIHTQLKRNDQAPPMEVVEEGELGTDV